jgi:hypothetical protein
MSRRDRIDPQSSLLEYTVIRQPPDRLALFNRRNAPVEEEGPLYVHVARLLIENPEDRDVLREDEFESIARAELYRTEKDARLKAI